MNNLSDSVLDVTSYYDFTFTDADPSAHFALVNSKPDTAVPSSEILIQEAQDRVAAYEQKQVKAATHLLPADQSATLFSIDSSTINVRVEVDLPASEDAYEAKIFGGLAFDKSLEKIDSKTLDDANNLADCINKSTGLWGTLKNDHTSDQVSSAFADAFQASGPCGDLHDSLESEFPEAKIPDSLEQAIKNLTDGSWEANLLRLKTDLKYAEDVHG